MTDLEKALEKNWRAFVTDDPGAANLMDYEPFKDLLDAARRFASLTSPETIEKAARELLEEWEGLHGSQGQSPKPNRHSAEFLVRAVLRSVEEGET